MPPKKNSKTKNRNGATLGIENELWEAADKLRGHLRQAKVNALRELQVHPHPSPLPEGEGVRAVKVHALRELTPTFPPAMQAIHLPLQGEVGGGWSALMPSILDKAFKGEL